MSANVNIISYSLHVYHKNQIRTRKEKNLRRKIINRRKHKTILKKKTSKKPKIKLTSQALRFSRENKQENSEISGKRKPSENKGLDRPQKRKINK